MIWKAIALASMIWPTVNKGDWCAEGQPGISVESTSIGKDLLAKDNHHGGAK